MRKEVKLGFAIGGVLLAVLFIYVLVISSGPPVKDRDVSLAKPELSSAPPVSQAADTSTSTEPAPQTTDPFKPQSTAAPSTAAPSTAAPIAGTPDDRWSKALHTGKLDAGEVPLLMTQTPAPAPPAQVDTALANAPVDASPAGPAAGNTSPAVPSNETLASQMGVSGPATAPAAGVSGAATSTPRTHVVQKGESFSTIAAAAYGNAAYYPHLQRANPNIDPKKLRVGMVVNIPDLSQVVATDNSSRTTAAQSGTLDASPAASRSPAAPVDERSQYRVQASDSLYKISLKLYGKSDRVDKLYELNKDVIGANPAHLKAGMVLKLPEPPTATVTAR